MQDIHPYRSPLGDMLLAADDGGLTGLWFQGQKYFARGLDREHGERERPIFEAVESWLDRYFSGEDPGPTPPLHLVGTDFQKEVWEILRAIPYGTTVTYGEIAGRLAERRGVPHLSAQAVGGAVGRNPVSILVPCHRVVGARGSLTGYAGGIERKTALLELEKAGLGALPAPERGRGR